MRRYEDVQETELRSVQCNLCGRLLRVEDHILKEGCFQVNYRFDYFSKRDGQVEKFDLCEDCYDKMTHNFILPVESEEFKEYL